MYLLSDYSTEVTPKEVLKKPSEPSICGQGQYSVLTFRSGS